MSRFTHFPKPPKGSRFANLSERLNAPLPGEEALVPSTDAKYSKRLPVFRPQVPASSAKATVSAAPAHAASVTPKAPAKSAATIAAEAYAERAAKVMNSSAAIGKKRAAAEMLGTTKASADEIILQLATVETDSVRQQAAIDATWKKAIERANNPMAQIALSPQEEAMQDTWKAAMARLEPMPC